MMVRRCIPLALATALVGCGKADNDPGPGNVTVGEARGLDEAAEMIEAGRLPAGAARPKAPEIVPEATLPAAP